MKKERIRLISLITAFCLLFSISAVPVSALALPAGLEYINTYENTGNQRMDVLGVALTQVGYREIVGNDTKYGNWYGLPGCAWCAMFVTWVARQADVPEDVLAPAHNARPEKFGIELKKGEEYTPQPGDLFFTKNLDHVGFVYYVEGDYFYTLEGNTENFDTVEFCVMSKQRVIKEFDFGVPDYKGTDGEHKYRKYTEESHPHKTYFECADCGDKFYTGYTECFIDCGSCISCNCSTSYAGYYRFNDYDYGWQWMRSSHSFYGDAEGCVSNGEVVYVYAANPAANLAFIEYDGHRGHVPYRNLTKYNKLPPEAPLVSVGKTDYIIGETVAFNWNEVNDAETYRLTVYKNNIKILSEKDVGNVHAYTLNNITEGSYKAELIALNEAGFSEKSEVEFSVRNIYHLSYKVGEGSVAPESQSGVVGEAIEISSNVPEKEGYTFLGWKVSEESNTAEYFGGSKITAYRDLSLYAVWKENSAELSSLEIYSEPQQKYYLLDEAINLKGLKLKLNYSDGSAEISESGFDVEGFDSSTIGIKTLTVKVGDKSEEFNIEVMEYIPGDIDLNKEVDRDDVMSLLWHITFPSEFPITVPADFTGDGEINRDDVITLLWHITFPTEFPLTVY